MSERLRFWLAVLSVPLWVGYPFAFSYGPIVARNVRCAGRRFTGGFDDCFNDYIPVLEMLAFPMTLLLMLPFLRFAFALYAPADHDGGWRWKIAGRMNGDACFPSLQLFAGLLILWIGFHVRMLPLAREADLLWAYWLIWTTWLLTGIAVSWPRESRAG
ncbi:hypothetical protein C100_03905 [Sphingobium sp. C100]|uniref:hypothetical protein n=1 Tax=Sphingobium sp. C100 TaxID=1207055 RepID=UPI0003D5FAA9|nr:hypothetical protein [Sphingobium sp. C100]ETI65087.1 hypothetical protein C100_03905 [Sphingobium sp. C100]